MEKEIVALFTKIDLKPMDGEEFYIFILPEECQCDITYNAWVFRKGYTIAYCSFGVKEHDKGAVSMESIKRLDDDGYFDWTKEKLLELE